MSPRWRDVLRVYLHPNRVVLAHLPAGWRTQRGHCRAIDVEAAAHDWRPALGALTDALTALGNRQPALTVTLSNRFAQFTLVAMDPRLDNARQREGFARHICRERYGDRIDTSVLRISPTGGAGPHLVSAVDRALIDAVIALARARGSQLRSLQPLLSAVFNANRASLDAACAWLVIAEQDHCVTALLDDAQWATVSAHRVGFADVGDVLARERVQAGTRASDAPVFLFNDSGEGVPPRGLDADDVRILIPRANFESDGQRPKYAAALFA